MICPLTVQAASIWPQPYYSLQLLIYSEALLMECGGGETAFFFFFLTHFKNKSFYGRQGQRRVFSSQAISHPVVGKCLL